MGTESLKINHKAKRITEAFGVDANMKEKLEEFFKENQGKPLTLLIQEVWEHGRTLNEKVYLIFGLGNIAGANNLSQKLFGGKENPTLDEGEKI